MATPIRTPNGEKQMREDQDLLERGETDGVAQRFASAPAETVIAWALEQWSPQKGDDARAGRWWWEQNAVKECGIHGLATAARGIC
jgi:hypothetical protein